MRLLVTAALLGVLAPSAPAADKDADKAKEAAVTFLKAVKAKDVKAAMKASGLPFVYDDGKGDKLAVIGDEVAMEFWLEPWFAKIKDPDQFPAAVTTVESVADLKDVADKTLRSWINTAAGKDGFVATVPKVGRLLVRVKDGKATVVGLLK